MELTGAKPATHRHARIVESQARDPAATCRSPRKPRGRNRGSQVEAFQRAVFAASSKEAVGGANTRDVQAGRL